MWLFIQNKYKDNFFLYFFILNKCKGDFGGSFRVHSKSMNVVLIPSCLMNFLSSSMGPLAAHHEALPASKRFLLGRCRHKRKGDSRTAVRAATLTSTDQTLSRAAHRSSAPLLDMEPQRNGSLTSLSLCDDDDDETMLAEYQGIVNRKGKNHTRYAC